MRSIFIVSRRTISPNGRGGASAIHYDQLNALSELGHQIHLWHYCYPNQRQEFNRYMENESDVWSEIVSKCNSVTLTTLPDRPSLANRLNNKIANLMSRNDILNPLLREVAFPVLARLIKRTKPDFIWSQHFGATQVAALQNQIPVVYSHHDWLYRIKTMDAAGEGNGRLRDAEEVVARKAAAVVSGSAVECEQLRQVGCKNVAYIPVTYESANLDRDAWPSPRSRLVHLGGLGTTANRLGLERFFEVVWPAVADNVELLVIGDTSEAPASLRGSLAAVKCTGHVKELGTVLRPFDLHIIPWEHNTGQRTRMVLAFNHAQVVVAVRASVAGFPEAVDGKNCRLVDRLDQMVAVIKRLTPDVSERRRLGLAARETFENSFTRNAMLPRYESVISSTQSPRILALKK
jgi:glycosyltransferase involved in cell wall biosynthesis